MCQHPSVLLSVISSSSVVLSFSTNHPLAEVRTDRAMGNLALLSVLPGYEGPAVIVESSNNSANVTEWVEDPEEVVVEEDEDDLGEF